MLEQVQIVGQITLKELRQLVNMTQQEFAKEVGIPCTTYRKYESDMSNMYVSKLFQISDRFNIPIEKFKQP